MLDASAEGAVEAWAGTGGWEAAALVPCAEAPQAANAAADSAVTTHAAARAPRIDATRGLSETFVPGAIVQA